MNLALLGLKDSEAVDADDVAVEAGQPPAQFRFSVLHDLQRSSPSVPAEVSSFISIRILKAVEMVLVGVPGPVPPRWLAALVSKVFPLSRQLRHTMANCHSLTVLP